MELINKSIILYYNLDQCYQKINKQKATKRAPTQIPPRGMGNGLERAYSKNDFITAVTISKD